MMGSLFRYNFRPEVGDDVISGLVVEHFGMDVTVKFGDSRSNGSRDIRGAGFVSNEHDRSLSDKAETSYRRFA